MLGWEPWGDDDSVTTDRDEYTADALVFAAGGWNQNLLPLLRGLAVPERQVLAWLQPTRPELFRPERFPVFNCLVPEGRYYGFPVFGIPGFKFGRYHHFEEAGEAEEISREVFREDEAVLRDFAARYFPDGAGPTMSLKACLFTNTPDNHFLIDLHPDHPQVSFAAGRNQPTPPALPRRRRARSARRRAGATLNGRPTAGHGRRPARAARAFD